MARFLLCVLMPLRLSLYSPCLRGNGKEVLAENLFSQTTLLSHTHTHTHTHARTHLTSSLFTPGTTLSTRLARDAAILPHSSQCQNLCQAPWAVPAPTYLTPGSPGLSFSALTKGKTTSPNELASRSSGTISPPGSQMLSWHFPGYSLHFTFPDWKRTNYLIVQLFLRAEL